MLKGTLNIKYTRKISNAKRDATWEQSAYLSDYGAFDLVAKYNDKLAAAGHRQPGGKPSGKRKGSVRYAGASRAAATIMDEDLHIVMEVMAKRKLEGSIAQWLASYKAEIAKVERLRMVETTDPNEYPTNIAGSCLRKP